jgi:Trypsin-like peptidase domain
MTWYLRKCENCAVLAMINEHATLIRYTLLAACALCCTFESIAAGTGYANERRAVVNRLDDSADSRQFNSIGVVSTASHTGTGFLVSPCLVLTNYHVAFGIQDRPKVSPTLKFEFGQTGDPKHPFRHAENAIPVGAGEYMLKRRSLQEFDSQLEKELTKMAANGANAAKQIAFRNRQLMNQFGGSYMSEDWALLKLEHSVPKEFVGIPLMPFARDMLSRIPLITAGFPGDLGKVENFVNLYGDMRCSASETVSNPDVIISDCMSNSGDSGSPIMARATDGSLIAVGIVSSAARLVTDVERMIGKGDREDRVFDSYVLRYPDLFPTEFEISVRKAFDATAPAHAISETRLALERNGVRWWHIGVGLFTATLPEDYFASALDAKADKSKIAGRADYVPNGRRIQQLIDANRCLP